MPDDMETGCICCGADAWVPLWRVLRRCGGCGFVRAAAGLTAEEVRRLYQADYFRGQEYADMFLSGALAGTPEQVVERLSTVRDLGMSYFIGYFPELAYDTSGVELFERAISLYTAEDRAHDAARVEAKLASVLCDAGEIEKGAERMTRSASRKARWVLLVPGGPYSTTCFLWWMTSISPAESYHASASGAREKSTGGRAAAAPVPP